MQIWSKGRIGLGKKDKFELKHDFSPSRLCSTLSPSDSSHYSHHCHVRKVLPRCDKQGASSGDVFLSIQLTAILLLDRHVCHWQGFLISAVQRPVHRLQLPSLTAAGTAPENHLIPSFGSQRGIDGGSLLIDKLYRTCKPLPSRFLFPTPAHSRHYS